MNNERVTFFKKTSEEIENLPTKSGQLIFDTTNKHLKLDNDNEHRITFYSDEMNRLNTMEDNAQENRIEHITLNNNEVNRDTQTKTVNIATEGTYNASTNKMVTKSYVDTAIDNLAEPMIFKGSLGEGGTITTLPVAAQSNEGFVYKVITDGTYQGQDAEAGDTFISTKVNNNTYIWTLIPSGDEPKGTVKSITLSATSPIDITNNGQAITESGSRTISHATSGVTRGNYGDNSNQTPDYGDTFKVPYIAVNETGHVTTASEHTVTLPKMKSYYAMASSANYTKRSGSNYKDLLTIDCEDFDLIEGASIIIKFNFNLTEYSTNGIYMNINNTGEKRIYWGNSYSLDNNCAYLWSSGLPITFIYDGTYYRAIGYRPATTSYWGLTKLSTSTSSTATNLAATPSAVKAAYDLANTANTGLSSKQDTLVSGTNIKTINNTSLLGEGNISITVPTNVSDLTNDKQYQSSCLIDMTALGTLANDTWTNISNTDVIAAINNWVNMMVTQNTIPIIITSSFYHTIPISYMSDPTNGTFIEAYVYDDRWVAYFAISGSNQNGYSYYLSSFYDTVPITTITSTSNDSKIPTAKAVYTLVNTKQDTLVSGTNIKTINNESILGSGNISISGGGATITVDDTISSISENPVQNKVIYTELSNKVNAVSGKGLSTNDYTTTEKNKLSGIATGAQVNVIETIKVNNTTLTPSSKAVNITVPTKVSDLTNDSGYTTNTGTITGVSANGTSIATSGVANIPAASTSAYGVTQLSSSTSSTSTTLAATPSAVKAAYDRASTAITNASTNATAIANIKNGTNLNSFGDVESALDNKADSTSVTSQISALSDEIYDNCELVSNKSTSITSSSTNIQYPTAKAVYDYTPRTYSGSGDPDNTIGKNGDIYIQI